MVTTDELWYTTAKGKSMNISEIAKLAGVSSAAVSRYFNNGYISEEKKEAIRKVVEQTGYRPSVQAQTLRTKKTKMIGVIVPKVASTSIGKIVEGILSVLNESGYQMLLAVTQNNPKKELEYDKELRGPKNLAVNLKNTRLEGAVSAASQSYREGLTWIDEKARLEAPTINNGVVVTLDTDSTWIVTKTCYLTGLHIGKYSMIKAPEGQTLTLFVDGTETKINQSTDYTGKIVLKVQ